MKINDVLNDLYGSGWGLPLFWPFSHRHYKVLGRRVNWSKDDLVSANQWEAISHEERRLRLVVSWAEEEMPEYIRKWGVDNWISGIYLKCTWISVIEYSLFIAACVLIATLLF